MRIQATPPYNPSFGLNRTPVRRIDYRPNCYIEKEIVKLKENTILVSRNYLDNKLSSTLFYVKNKAGNWVKSKLKYIEDGVLKVIRSERNAN